MLSMRQEIVRRQNSGDHRAGLRKGQVVAASPLALRDPMRAIVSTFRKVSTETDQAQLSITLDQARRNTQFVILITFVLITMPQDPRQSGRVKMCI